MPPRFSILKKAQRIRENAKTLLLEKGIQAQLESLGELHYTGSYLLDLMTWNDIDMQIVLKTGSDPIQVLGKFFRNMSKDPSFIEAQMIHFTKDYKPKMPRGVYLGLKLYCPEYGGMWKLDVWSLSNKDFQKNKKLLEKLQSRLTPDLRKFLLEVKTEMMEGKKRMPQTSSHLLYQAVLLEGITEKKLLFDHISMGEGEDHFRIRASGANPQA